MSADIPDSSTHASSVAMARVLTQYMDNPVAVRNRILQDFERAPAIITIERMRRQYLATPKPEEVAEFLVERFDVSPTRAAHAARASQGHIGRAKALALEEATRGRRREVVSLPPRLTSLGACMTAAQNLVEIATASATS